MGYVNPSSSPEPRGFEDQFEWDGHSWLFRRFHRARPVRVTADEMDDCIDYYERWSGRTFFAVIGLWTALAILLEIFGPDESQWAAGPVAGLAGLGCAATAWTGRNWIWRRATERFARRVPVGVGQNWLEDRQGQAIDAEWTALILPIAILGFGTYLVWPLDEAHWFEFAMAAVAGLAALLDLGLKFRARFL